MAKDESRSQTNSENKLKEIHTKTHDGQTSENQKQTKITETVRKQQLVYGRKTIQRREDFHDTVKARSQGHKELDMTE